MPYRTLTPWRRPWWEKLAALWMLVIAGMGLHGMTVVVDNLAGSLRVGQTVFSTLLLSLALSAFLAWWKGARQPELIFMTGIAVLTLAHGSALWIFVGGHEAQPALRIIAAGIGTLAWVGIRHEFGISRSQVKEVAAVVKSRDDGKG